MSDPLPVESVFAAPLSEEEFDRLLAEAILVCQIPAPTFAETERAAFVRGRFRELGVETYTDEVGNIVARISPGENPLVTTAHLDTVFSASTEVQAARMPDRLVGAGIGDNSLAVAMLLLLARRLVESPPDLGLVLVATVGEEGEGDLRGAKHIVNALQPRAFVALEGHLRDDLIVGGVGSLRFSITARTRGGHSWLDRGNVSAVHYLVERCATLLSEVPDRHMNIGLVEGGTSINSIAAKAMCKIDCRDEDDSALATVEDLVRSIFEPTVGSVACDVQIIGRRPAGRTAHESWLLVLARAARQAAGLAPAREIRASTDANAAFGQGIPALAVGLTIGHGVHTNEEWVEIEPLRAGAAAAAALVEVAAR